MTTKTNHPDPAAPGTTCETSTTKEPFAGCPDDFPDKPFAINMENYLMNEQWIPLKNTLTHSDAWNAGWHSILYRRTVPEDGLPGAEYILRDPADANKRPPSTTTLMERHEKLRTFARLQREVESYNEITSRAPDPIAPDDPEDVTDMLRRSAAGLASLTQLMVFKACAQEKTNPAPFDADVLQRMSQATTMLKRLTDISRRIDPPAPKPKSPIGRPARYLTKPRLKEEVEKSEISENNG